MPEDCVISIGVTHDCPICQDAGCVICAKPATNRVRSTHPEEESDGSGKYGPCAAACIACEEERRIGMHLDASEHWPACKGCQRLLKMVEGLCEALVRNKQP